LNTRFIEDEPVPKFGFAELREENVDEKKA